LLPPPFFIKLGLNNLNLKHKPVKTTKKYGKKADLALSMWVKLARASQTFGKLTQKHIHSFELTEPQFGVLECLVHVGPLTLGELSRKHLVSGGNMTCVVDNLEKEGLVERIPSKTDRRAITVQLTQKGKNLIESIFVQHAEYVTEIASVLTEDEQERLSVLLKKLGLALKEKSEK
jgi:MarR family transcriptional regulator, 2-MHQ and catechol-resistance regulon repressor